MEEIEKIRKKIRKEIEENIEMDDSNIPIHEKYVKEEHIKSIKKKNKKNFL